MPTHNTRYTMGPRLREDDKIRDRKRLIDQSYKEEVGITKMRQGTSTAPLSHKHSAHRRHGPQLSFPCTRETIYPHAPGAALGNTLTATNNKNNVNTVAIPTYYTRYTMGPRVREDDEIRDRKGLIDRSYKEEVGITKMRQDKPTAPLSHKHSAHRRHTTNCHSRAHGKPFIRTRQVPR